MPRINSSFDESAFSAFLETNQVQRNGLNLPAVNLICEQFAAETEAVVFLTENYGDPEFHAEVSGISAREEIVTLSGEIRLWGSRIRAENGGLLYECF